MALADDLLEQAHHLARREKSKPRQASLRRAISTAYYALFHLLISEAVLNWKRSEHRFDLARSFEHGQMRAASELQKKVLLRQQKMADPKLDGEDLSIDYHLLKVVSNFVELQQQRHLADYDNSRVWTRVEALNEVHSASEAFRSWQIIRNEPAAQDYLFSLMLKKR